MGRTNDEEGKKVDEDKLPRLEVCKETEKKPWENDSQGNNQKRTRKEMGRAHSPAGSELWNSVVFLFLAAPVVV